MKYLIVNYNTSLLVNALINNIQLFDKNSDICVFDNSDKCVFTTEYANTTILDNTNNNLLNFDTEWRKITQLENKNNGSWKHAMSVEWFFEYCDEPFVLLDSDVIIKKDISNIIRTDILFAGDVVCNRVLPMCIYINTPLCKAEKKRFFDGVTICPFKEVDTGYYFRNVCANGPILKFNMFEYIYHLGGASYDAWCLQNYKTEIFGNTFGHSDVNKHKAFIYYCRNFIPDWEKLLNV